MYVLWVGYQHEYIVKAVSYYVCVVWTRIWSVSVEYAGSWPVNVWWAGRWYLHVRDVGFGHEP